MRKTAILAIFTAMAMTFANAQPALTMHLSSERALAEAARLKTQKPLAATKKIVKRRTIKKTSIKTPANKAAAIVAPAFVRAPFPTTIVPSDRYAHQLVHEEPIILTGTDSLEIANTRYLQRGKIILKDHAELIIRDSHFEQRNPGESPVTLEAYGQSKITITDSEVSYSPHINWTITDEASLTLTNVRVIYNTANDWNVWHLVSKRARVRARDTVFSGSLSGEVQVDINGSPESYLELALPQGAIIDERLPYKIDDYVFPNIGDYNVYLKMHLTNSTVVRWAVVLKPYDDVTLRDSGPLNISFIMGWPWLNESAVLDNLKTAAYADREVRLKDTRLHLLNTAVNEWTPLVGENNQLTIRNSDLGDQLWSWGNARLMIENSTTTAVRARENVNLSLRNSTVLGDVSAADNGQVTIINTVYKGKKLVEGKGKIVE